MFASSDSGLVLKAIHLPREHGQSQEVTLEQLQVFQVQKAVFAENIRQCMSIGDFIMIFFLIYSVFLYFNLMVCWLALSNEE